MTERPRGRGRRRGGDGGLILISWRDIPAQVNAGSGENRVQRILPRRFQRAIDRAAMVAGKTQASEYVGEWRRTVIPANGSDPEAAAIAAAEEIEANYPRERLAEFVATGGWHPSRTDSDGDKTAITDTTFGDKTAVADRGGDETAVADRNARDHSPGDPTSPEEQP